MTKLPSLQQKKAELDKSTNFKPKMLNQIQKAELREKCRAKNQNA